MFAHTTSLLDSQHNLSIDTHFYIRTILPIGILCAGSLVCSNIVYLYLSVSVIQMLKSVAPIAVLLISWAWGVAEPSLSRFVNILVIGIGVVVASFGESEFSWIGFAFQLGGTIFEAMRLVMIQVMLNGGGYEMDPLVGLYYYAPVSTVIDVLIAAATDAPKFKWGDLASVSFGILFLNAFVAFMLNISSVLLIGKTSGLVMTLSGVFKSILLVAVSFFIWSTQITLLQGAGYSIALAGLIYYTAGSK